MKKMHVGNLPFTATDDQISRRFGQHGTVRSVALINDRETGRPHGFGGGGGRGGSGGGSRW